MGNHFLLLMISILHESRKPESFYFRSRLWSIRTRLTGPSRLGAEHIDATRLITAYLNASKVPLNGKGRGWKPERPIILIRYLKRNIGRPLKKKPRGNLNQSNYRTFWSISSILSVRSRSVGLFYKNCRLCKVCIHIVNPSS